MKYVFFSCLLDLSPPLSSLPVLQKAAKIAAAQSVEVAEYKAKLQTALVEEAKVQEELDHAQLDIAAKVSGAFNATSLRVQEVKGEP